MATVQIPQKTSAKITDQIVFRLITRRPQDSCLINPYEVTSATIFFIERNFIGGKDNEFQRIQFDQTLLDQVFNLTQEICQTPNPTEEQLAKLDRLQIELENTKQVNSNFFNEANAVQVFGGEDFPLWNSDDTANAQITKVDTDENGNTLLGNFDLEWGPIAQRDGDYFLCWTYQLNPAGDPISDRIIFSLRGDTLLTTATPDRATDPRKYETLLERYLPENFKMRMIASDLSPEVLQEFNNSVAEGFAMIEDLGNNIIDLLNANVVPESLLPLLGNYFNLKLRGNDPTRWRRQIRRAIPLFKQKGTRKGLEEALEQAGIRLVRFAQMWQVISEYTFQEPFMVVENDQSEFFLSRVAILPIDTNFELFYRPATPVDAAWQELDVSDYISLTTTSFTWIGDTAPTPITLSQGDDLRLIYKVVEVPGAAEQMLEDFVRTLPLADQRDDRNQAFPLKNWNVRLIEEDDPMLDVVIRQRHPFFDPVIFGQIRTEFPYSENIYNMEEYNGSKRDSTNPCDIDRDFLDPCQSCLSSNFVVEIEIDQMSNDRIAEAQEIIREFKPFQAMVHSINFIGSFDDFIPPPQEDVALLIQYVQEEPLTFAHRIFNRSMELTELLDREDLANVMNVFTNSAILKNNRIMLFAPTIDLNTLGLYLDPAETVYNLLEVLGPSANVGEYSILDINGSYAEISSDGPMGPLTTPVEPLNQEEFTFRLSTEIYRKTSTTITQDNMFVFSDPDIDLQSLNVVTQEDVDKGVATGPAWRIDIPLFGSTYTISDLTLDNKFRIIDDGTLPATTTTGLTYTLLDETLTPQDTGTTGVVESRDIGRIDLAGGTIVVRGDSIPFADLDNAQNIVQPNDWVLIGGVQYRVLFFDEDISAFVFFIDEYSAGDMAGVETVGYRRWVDNGTGFFHYDGLTLDTSPVDLEIALGILNGVNAPVDPNDILEDNLFKENFLINLGLNNSDYAIAEIDGMTTSLSGPPVDATTSGTATMYEVTKFEKPPVSIAEREELPTPAHDYPFIDRRGNEVFEIEIETGVYSMNIMASSMNPSAVNEMVSQEESINYTIEYKKDDNDN